MRLAVLAMLLALPLQAQSPVLVQTITGSVTAKNPQTGSTDTSHVRVSVAVEADPSGTDTLRFPISICVQGSCTETMASLRTDLLLKIESHTIGYGKRTSGGGTPVVLGVPFGAYSAWSGSTVNIAAPFSLGMGTTTPQDFPALDVAMAERKLAKFVNLFGGGSSAYLTSGKFSLTRWRNQLTKYTALRDALLASHAAGRLRGVVVLDEPFNVKWGGNLTKPTVDQMCREVQALLPGVPVGVTHQHVLFQPSEQYEACAFLIDQYNWARTKGDATAYLTGGLTYAARDGIATVFSLNILDGGVQAPRKDAAGRNKTNYAASDCPRPSTGGRGTFFPNCRMTPEQIREWGMLFGPAGCALLMWRVDAAMWRDPAYLAAFKDVADRLATVPRKDCKRTPA